MRDAELESLKDQKERLIEALTLACLWGGIRFDNPNSVMSMGINAILRNDMSDPRVEAARDLVRRKTNAMP